MLHKLYQPHLGFPRLSLPRFHWNYLDHSFSLLKTNVFVHYFLFTLSTSLVSITLVITTFTNADLIYFFYIILVFRKSEHKNQLSLQKMSYLLICNRKSSYILYRLTQWMTLGSLSAFLSIEMDCSPFPYLLHIFLRKTCHL